MVNLHLVWLSNERFHAYQSTLTLGPHYGQDANVQVRIFTIIDDTYKNSLTHYKKEVALQTITLNQNQNGKN
jgi:hypothetical protein